jgi:hypothetical protein
MSRTESAAASDDILGSDDEEDSYSRGPSTASNLDIHESEFRMPQAIYKNKFESVYRYTELFQPGSVA